MLTRCWQNSAPYGCWTEDPISGWLSVEGGSQLLEATLPLGFWHPLSSSPLSPHVLLSSPSIFKGSCTSVGLLESCRIVSAPQCPFPDHTCRVPFAM